MKLPGFTAELSVDNFSSVYKQCFKSSHKPSITPMLMIRGVGGVGIPIGGVGGVGIPATSGFACSRTSCVCVGDSDCNDLFSTSLCKSTGGLCTGRVCVCDRASQ